MAKKKPIYDSSSYIDFTQGQFDEDVKDIGGSLGFVATYDTPEKQQRLFNSKVAKVMESSFGSSPYKKLETDDGSEQYVFDKEARPLAYEEGDSFKDEMKKDVYNSLVRFEGGLPENSFLERTFAHSMTGDWASLIGDAFDVGGSMRMTEKGIKYEGELLSLTDDENDVFGKAIMRFNAEDRDKGFVEKTAETFTSLMWDLPLMMLSGAASARLIKMGGEVARTALASKQVGVRVGTQLVQQGLNFNILGLPQTVRSTQEYGVEAGLGEMWHNVQMGAFATMTGFAGRGVVKGVGLASKAIREQLRRNPALTEELGALGGSLGFGTGTSLMAGESWEDALSTGLAFMGTHLTNPKAYNEVIRQMKQSNIQIKVADKSKRKTSSPEDDYFVQDIDGKTYKIDGKTFTEKGEIVKTSTEGIEITEKNEADYKYLNEVESGTHKQFGELLGEERLKGGINRLVKRWMDNGELSRRDYREKKQYYDALAGQVVTSVAAKQIESNKKITIPENKELNDAIINFNNEHKIPYGAVKDFIIDNIEEYALRPEETVKRIEELFSAAEVRPMDKASKTAKDVVNLFEKTLDVARKIDDQKLIEELILGERDVKEKEKISKPKDELVDKGEGKKGERKSEILRTDKEREQKTLTDILSIGKEREKAEIEKVQKEKEEADLIKVSSAEKKPAVELAPEPKRIGAKEQVLEVDDKIATLREEFKELKKEGLGEGKAKRLGEIGSEIDVLTKEKAMLEVEATKEAKREETKRRETLRKTQAEIEKPIEPTERPFRFISEETYQKDIATIKKSGLTMGLDPKINLAYARAGAYHLENVVRKGIDKVGQFKEWSKEMLKAFGDGVKPHLLSIFEEAQREYAKKPIETTEPTPPKIGDGGTTIKEKPKSISIDGGSIRKPLQTKLENKTKVEPDFREQEVLTVDEYQSSKYGNENVDKIMKETASIRESMTIKDREVLKTSFENFVGKAKGSLKNMLKYTLPPVHFKDVSKEFYGIWEMGEYSKTVSSFQKNRILGGSETWKHDTKFTELSEAHRKNILDKIERYSALRYTKDIDKDMTWKEFKDWGEFSEAESRVIDAMQKTQAAAIEVMADNLAKALELDPSFINKVDPEVLRKEHVDKLGAFEKDEVYDAIEKKIYDAEKQAERDGKKKRITKLRESKRKKSFNPQRKDYKEIVAKEESRVKRVTKAFDKELQKLRDKYVAEVIRDRADGSPEEIHDIARQVVGERFQDWGKNFHYNMNRPNDPKIYHIDGERTNAAGELERIKTYAENEFERNDTVRKLENEGYTVTDSRRLSERIIDKGYRERMSSLELLELASRGDIPFDDAVLNKLIDASYKGVNVHKLKREYIPGMKFTEKEYLNQMGRFVRESVDAGVKAYSHKKMNMLLSEWENKLTSDKTQRSIEENKKLRGEYNYAQGYINQLKQPDRTFVDGIRGAAMLMQVGGLKPSFLLQQALQVAQTGIAQTQASGKKVTTGEAIKVYIDSFGEAVKLGGALKELKRTSATIDEIVARQGWSLSEQNRMRDKLKMIEELEWMDKITTTGMSEQLSLVQELDYGNQRSVLKNYRKLQDVMSILGRGVEKMTRIQVASMVYDTAYKNGMRGERLREHIAENIDKSMGEWGKGGRAPILYGRKEGRIDSNFMHGLRKAFMTYKTFSFYNYGQYAEMIRNKNYAGLGIKGMVGLGTHGLTKFPMMASMMMMANMFLDEDTDMDYEMLEMSRYLDREVGMKVGTVMQKGIGGVFGLDLSDQYAETFPLIPEWGATAWGKDLDEKVFGTAGGAPTSFALDVIKGIAGTSNYVWRKGINGDVATEKDKKALSKALKKFTPIFLRNFFKAMEYKSDGIELKGKEIVSANGMTADMIFLKAMSFKLSVENEMYEDAQFSNVAVMRRYKGRINEIVKAKREIRKILNTKELDFADRNAYIEDLKDLNDAKLKLAEERDELRIKIRNKEL